jgi:hypothetical protein
VVVPEAEVVISGAHACVGHDIGCGAAGLARRLAWV